jgi:hypothetical protein
MRASIQTGMRNRVPGMSDRVPEARYAYYRRCHVFRRNGEQCRAPAEKGVHVCYAHARQQAMEDRRKRERQAVLEEAARRMRLNPKVGKRHEQEGCDVRSFSAADIFTDFNAIQATLAVVAQAIIDGRIDCKTAGRLCWELQFASKLLWLKQRAARVAGQNRGLEQSGSERAGVPERAAEQILRPHAEDLEERRGDASSAPGWGLHEEAQMTKPLGTVIERAA